MSQTKMHLVSPKGSQTPHPQTTRPQTHRHREIRIKQRVPNILGISRPDASPQTPRPRNVRLQTPHLWGRGFRELKLFINMKLL